MDLKITGMTCGHCKSSVEEALNDVDGVSAVTVDLENGKAQVTGSASLQSLIDAVVEEGFQAEALEAA